MLSAASSEWIAATRKELTSLMWANAGIVRNTADMQKGLVCLGTLCQEVRSLVKSTGVTTALTELQNLATVGELIMASAVQRKESRGLHYCVDFPFVAQDQCHPTVIKSSMRRRSEMSKMRLHHIRCMCSLGQALVPELQHLSRTRAAAKSPVSCLACALKGRSSRKDASPHASHITEDCFCSLTEH